MGPSRRSVVRWMSIAATWLLLAVWVGSGWWGLRLSMLPTIDTSVVWGSWRISWERPWSIRSAAQPDVRFGPIDWTSVSPRWWFERRVFASMVGTTHTDVHVPVWFLALLAAVPAVCVRRGDLRRRKMGLCRACDYDLRGGGHEEGKCPECGNAASDERQAISEKTRGRPRQA